MRTARAFPWASMVLINLVIAAGPGRAQPGGAGAAVDSLDRPVFGFLRPTYNSTYIVNRQQTNWQQDFAFSNKWSGVSIDNKTGYVVKTDPNRTNFRARSGSTSSQLAFTLLGRVPLTTSLNYTRSRLNDTFLQQRQDLLDTGLKASYNLRLFQGARSAVNGGFGVERRKDSNTYKDTETGARESGLSRDLTISTTYNGPTPGMVFKVSDQFGAVRTRPEAINSAAGASAANTPRTNTRSSHSFNWSYNRWESVNARLDLTQNRSRSGYIIVSRDRTIANKEETASDESRNLGIGLSWKPKAKSSEASLDFKSNRVLNRRAVEVERASDRLSTSVDARVKHTVLGSPFFLHVENSHDDDRSEVRGASRTLLRAIDANIERPWTPDFSTRLVGEIRLRSQEYDDAIQDNDDLKTRVEGAVTWKPWSRLSGTLTGHRTISNGVSISRSQSRNSRLEENFGLIADLKYTLSSRTRISQKYEFQALFTSYIYNAPQDNLARTRDVNTAISTQLSPTVSVELRHSYQFREAGGYRRDAAGTRYFSKANLRYVQDLTTSVSYRPTNWLNFSTNERLYRTDDVQVLDDHRSVLARMEMTQTAGLSRSIPGGGTFKCDTTVFIQKMLRPVAGRAERFFSATLSLNKPF